MYSLKELNMFGTLFDLASNVTRIVTAPVEVVVNVANDFVAKPVADLAQEVVDELQDK